MEQIRQRVATATNFNAVLGTGRGSVAAQAQRDIAARQHRDDVLDEFSQTIGSGSELYFADKLIATYLLAKAAADVADKIIDDLKNMEKWQRAEALKELADIIAHGDPFGCEGLTAPAVLVVSDFLGASARAGDSSRERLYAVSVMGNVFGRPQNEGYYRRLQGLCQQIADILRGADPDEVGGLVQAVLLSLELAPEAALAGPLQCWIQALTQRRHSKAMGVFERSMMETLLERYCPGSVGATALAPLAD